MNTITWELNFLSPPKTIRYCKKCGAKTQYVSSEAFRINAQQKSLDIWLIYRCEQCKTTWNMAIYSRAEIKSIGHELLEQFTSNDRELALRYAMDIELLKRSGAETEIPSFAVTGEDVDLTQGAIVRIMSRYPLGIRVSKIIREKLMLSKRDFDEMAETGFIRLADGADIKKCRLKNVTLVFINGARESAANMK